MGLKNNKPRRWLYAAIVLNDYSRDLLLKKNIVPHDWNIGCDHITLCYNDNGKETGKFLDKISSLVGKFICVNATGVGVHSDGNGLTGLFALKAELPEGIPCRNTTPHVTLGWRPPMKPRESNDITEWVTLSTPITLMGRIRIIYENN